MIFNFIFQAGNTLGKLSYLKSQKNFIQYYISLKMQFQVERKGLFTFYKQQQDIQPELQRKKLNNHQKAEPKYNQESLVKTSLQIIREVDAESKLVLPVAPKYKNNRSAEKAIQTLQLKQKVTSVLSRRQTQLLKEKKAKQEIVDHQITSKEQGCFLQNKNISFIPPIKLYRKPIQALARYRKPLLKRSENLILSNKRYDRNEEHTDKISRLPTLSNTSQITKVKKTPYNFRNKNAQSLLKFSESSLMQQIRTLALEENKKKEVNRSVSHIQYNCLYQNHSEVRAQKLPIQQKKLLLILSRYRFNDF